MSLAITEYFYLSVLGSSSRIKQNKNVHIFALLGAKFGSILDNHSQKGVLQYMYYQHTSFKFLNCFKDGFQM